MIEKIDLYKMMFHILDSIYDEIKDNDLGNYLSSANPFLFKDETSADPSIYNEFCKLVSKIDESEYGYQNILEYLKKINDGKLEKFFLTISKKEWIDAFKDYLNSK